MKRKIVPTLLTAAQLDQLLKSARSHYRHILKQENFSAADIRRLERKCARPSFCSRFYMTPREDEQSPTAAQLVTIEHLVHSIAVFRSAVKSRDVYSSFQALYEVAGAQAALFRFNNELWTHRQNARKAAQKKHGKSDEWIAHGGRIFAARQSEKRQSPTRDELHGLLTSKRKDAGLKPYSYSWVCKNWPKISAP